VHQGGEGDLPSPFSRKGREKKEKKRTKKRHISIEERKKKTLSSLSLEDL